MSDKNFASKVDRLIEEIDSAAVANGEELSWLEISSAVYEKMFNEPAPRFEYDLPDKVKTDVLLECLEMQKPISEFSEVEFLQLQYRIAFGETLTYDFMGLRKEKELIAALRESLKTGKPYELPNNVKRLLDQGVDF